MRFLDVQASGRECSEPIVCFQLLRSNRAHEGAGCSKCSCESIIWSRHYVTACPLSTCLALGVCFEAVRNPIRSSSGAIQVWVGGAPPVLQRRQAVRMPSVDLHEPRLHPAVDDPRNFPGLPVPRGSGILSLAECEASRRFPESFALSLIGYLSPKL